MLFMENMSVLYPFPKYWEAWQVAGASFLLLSLSMLAIITARRRPYLIVGWLWFLGTLVPTISLVAVGFQSIADRYTYVSLIGVFIMVVWGAADFLQRWPIPRIALRTGGVVVSLICCAVTAAQLTHWQSSVSLWTHALAVTKDNAIAHYNLGHALTSLGKIHESLYHYEEAVRLKADYVDANLNLGATLMYLGRVQEATNRFAKALSVKPDFDEAHNYMGSALLALGQADAAASHFTKALEINSTNSLVHFNLGLALFRLGQTERAIAHLSEALRLEPSSAETHFQLGLAYLSQRKAKEAVIHYRETLRLKPDFTAALNNLAWLLATHPDETCRNGAEAVRLAEKACELTAYKQPLLLGTLAAAYAETGDFDKAISTAQKARDLAEMSGEKNLVVKNEKLLEEYRAGKPHREAEQL
jgi:tetratricopeptide (TPR) repeat protein